jgi:pimeloyl-ACP methyl ester carboxylesterase
MGRLEALDVAAAVSVARPDLPVVTIGTSLGGAAVLLHAGTHGGVAGVFAVSAPGWWEGDPERPGTRRLRHYVDSPAGRQILARVLRTRLGPCAEEMYDADAAVAAIAPAFTIVVHDPDDSYFGPEHAEHLFALAGEPKELWWYHDAGHGTDLLTPDFAGRVLAEISLRVPAPSR